LRTTGSISIDGLVLLGLHLTYVQGLGVAKSIGQKKNCAEKKKGPTLESKTKLTMRESIHEHGERGEPGKRARSTLIVVG